MLEEADPERTFSIGLLYGPSGCGKSSLVKAGVVPRLNAGVRAIVLEASGDDTEPRLLKAIRKAVPGLEEGIGLVASIAWLRENSDRKTVVVLDQFEQWLQAHPDPTATDLVAALRQCDGGRLQAIVLVRDDFALAANRFMQAVETPIVEGRNYATIDSFPVDHARDVLVQFGQGLGRLPRLPTQLSAEENAFVDRATAGIAGDAKRVVPVQLALFADLVKDRPWTQATLEALGDSGVATRRLLDGVGVAFLEESFHSRSANPTHRAHAEAAKRVLEALLPDSGMAIKGHKRSEAELLAVSGLEVRPIDFQTLLGTLDNDLRLITPADPPDGEPSGVQAGHPRKPYYQLTHDYLVPALRDWLTGERRRTAKGRARLVLAERAAIWSERTEAQQLPSVFEWLRIRALTRSRDWRPRERRMMARADRHVGLKAAIGAIALLAAAAIMNEVRVRGRVDDAVNAILLAEASDVVPLVENAKRDPMIARRLGSRLRAAFVAPDTETSGNNAKRLRTAIGAALLSRAADDGADPVQTYLADHFVGVGPEDVDLILRSLEPRGGWIEERFEEFTSGANRLPAAAAIALHCPERFDRTIAVEVTRDLVRVRRDRLSSWLELFRGVRERIVEVASETCKAVDQSPGERFQAAEIVGEYGVEDLGTLKDLLLMAGPDECAILLDRMPQHRDGLVSLLEDVLAERCDERWTSSDSRREILGLRSARAGALLLGLRRPERVWPSFVHSADPRVRSHLIDLVWRYGVDPRLLIDRLAIEADVSARRALLLALGDAVGVVPEAPGRELIGEIEETFRFDPDAGIHAAARWFLRRWGKQSWVDAVERQWRDAAAGRPRMPASDGERRWFVDGIGMNYTLIDGPVELLMGSPESEVSRDLDEEQSVVTIQRCFAIGTTAVTNRQLAMWPGLRDLSPGPEIEDVIDNPDDRPAVAGLSWDEIARFCNWVSRGESIPESQWCYEEDGEGMRARDGWEALNGYRLPTEAELEYAIRAGATTSRFFGEGESLLPRYAWFVENSGPQKTPRPVGELKPNDCGLFDALGNCFVLANDRFLDESGRVITVLRGGSYFTQPRSLRSANRKMAPADAREIGLDGWRLARTISVPTGEPTAEPDTATLTANE